MKSYPFNSNITGYDSEGIPQFDRAIDAIDYRKFTSLFYTNGVISKDRFFQVTPGGGMSVLVSPGSGVIEGVIFHENESRKLVVQAPSSLDRIDTVVIRLNEAERKVDLYVVKGTPANVPTPPSLTRPIAGEAGDVYELGIANIFVTKNVQSISGDRITDTRLDENRCGIVVSPLLKIDSSYFQNQLTSLLANRSQQFDTWFTSIQNILDSNVAASILAKIKSVAKTITLSASAWTSSNTYVVSDSLITATSNQEILPGLNISAEQLKALQSANIQDGGQTSGKLTLKAFGDKPTTSIPVRIIFRGEK